MAYWLTWFSEAGCLSSRSIPTLPHNGEANYHQCPSLQGWEPKHPLSGVENLVRSWRTPGSQLPIEVCTCWFQCQQRSLSAATGVKPISAARPKAKGTKANNLLFATHKLLMCTVTCRGSPHMGGASHVIQDTQDNSPGEVPYSSDSSLWQVDIKTNNHN